MTVGGCLPTPCHKEKRTADSRKSHKMEILIAPHSSQLHLGGHILRVRKCRCLGQDFRDCGPDGTVELVKLFPSMLHDLGLKNGEEFDAAPDLRCRNIGCTIMF